MAWSNHFGRYTLGGRKEMNFTTVTNLDSTENRTLVQPVRIEIDPEASGSVEISYNDGVERVIDILEAREVAYYPQFDSLSDIRVKPSQNESNIYIYFIASTDTAP